MFSFDFDANTMFEDYLRENGDEVRRRMEEIVRRRVAEAIGQANLARVTLSFRGTGPGDLKMHVSGPKKLKAKIEAALRPATLGPEPSPTRAECWGG